MQQHRNDVFIQFDRPSLPQRTARGLLLLTLMGATVFVGCTRAPEPTFTAVDGIEELPDLHQQNIAEGLRAMFGTPSRPKLLLTLPVQASEDGEESDGEEESDAADEEESLTFVDPDRLRHGARVYQQRCAGCHGVGGDGKGEAAPYLQPKPRDYRNGIFKFTSTSYGERPTRQDLVRTIRRGAKGTSMPAFPWMSDEDIQAVIDYIIYFSMRGRVEQYLVEMSEDYDEDEPIDPIEFADSMADEVKRWSRAQSGAVNPISAEPTYDLASVEQGRRLFIKSSCYNCHGEDAKGQTEWLSPEFLAAQESATGEDKVQINYDAWGDPAPAANITARMLHGGRRPLDIYRRVYTGINGTPMPQYGQVFADDPDSIWHLVHYVLHIVDGGDPTAGISMAEVQAEVKAEEAAAKAAAEEAAADEADAAPAAGADSPEAPQESADNSVGNSESDQTTESNEPGDSEEGDE